MSNKNNAYVVSADQLRAVEAEAQAMRAEAIQNVARAIGNGIASLFRPLTSLGKRTAAHFERKRTVERIFGELAYMTDRDLADIGLHRSDIYAVAHGTYVRQDQKPAKVVEIRPAAKVEAGEAEYHRAA